MYALLLVVAMACAEERGLPLVVEQVDEILVIQTIDCDHQRVVFLRGGRVLATRLAVDDMQWVTCGDSVQLIWQDYWTAERVVEAKTLSVYQSLSDPTQESQDGLWWCMFRNMRDLKQP